MGSLRHLMSELTEVLSEERVSENQTILEQHSKDESYHQPRLPDAVVYPENTDEVSEIVRLASKYEAKIIPFGLGSSLEGHVIPVVDRTITVDFSLMNHILEVKEKDFLVKVQPGVTRTQLNKELKKYGLFFPVDPGADATLGGMAATNASGTMSVRYGIMRDQVLDLEVVLADGTIIHTGSQAAKSSSGYHLNGLFVGSEGTLGCITELTVKVYGIPEHTMAARATFATMDDALDAVTAIKQSGVQIARVEFVDAASIRQANLHSDTEYEDVPTLFLEFHGNEAGLKQDVGFVEEIVKEFNCREVQFEKDTAARNKLWEARHNLAYAFIAGNPGRKMMVTDVCVPLSELADAVRHARKSVESLGIPAGITGHVGDGNYHIIFMIDLNNPKEVQKADQLNELIVEYALERGGTCTGEHGVGFGKQKYQAKEHGNSIQVMEKIKLALDPESLFNPNKILVNLQKEVPK